MWCRASNDPRVQALSSVKYVWKDLRADNRCAEIVQRASLKFGSQVAVFGESCRLVDGIKFADRHGHRVQGAHTVLANASQREGFSGNPYAQCRLEYLLVGRARIRLR